MVFSYYPGCTLKTQAKELDRLARNSAKVLGIILEEVEDWQCCGAVYPLGTDEIATKLASVRVLKEAAKKGQPLVTLCAACTHVIKRVNDDMKNNGDIRRKVNKYMEEEADYKGETEVLHLIEVINKYIGFDKLKEYVKNPLTGRKIGAYYGCMLLRPSSVMAFDDPENPTIFEKFIKALGADPVIYPYRNECCGGYISLKEKDRVKEMVATIKENAKHNGAEQLITACPLCLYNLKQISCRDLNIDYLTEILAEALGITYNSEEEVSYAYSK
ncbi:MAG: CoB--CoM heterodisulfide reductase iron-sulfur subunit B family protein [Defluviitaleaceae bacterium]|nr:CoB--CoM heterodisulfide reductase iron-sulfur subunit B family protein [Defluviitaleaceae bacterium]